MVEHFISCYEKSKRIMCEKLYALENFNKSVEYTAKNNIFNKIDDFVAGKFLAKKTLDEMSVINEVETFIHKTTNEDYQSVPFDTTMERQTAIETFIIKATRLYRWYVRELFKADEIVGFGTMIKAKNPLDESEWLHTTVTAIIKVGDETEYIKIHRGKNKRGTLGKNFDTNPYGELDALVIDLGTEDTVTYVPVYLEKDKEEDVFYPELVEGKDKGSNVLRIKMDYKKPIKINKVAYGASEDILRDALTAACNGKCESCFYKKMCQLETLDEAIAEIPEEKPVKAMGEVKFNKEQTEVIENMTDNMVVCAGPGTGKTATLVGKVLHEIAKDVPASAILCITYTNKAVKEIVERLEKAGVLDMPTVCTIDALAYNICKENGNVLGFVPNILTVSNSMDIIREIIFDMGIENFAGLGRNLYGKHGKIKKCYNICSDAKKHGLKPVLEEIESKSTKSKQKYGEIAVDVAEELYERFDEVVKEEHLFEFDEVKRLCLDLLVTKKEIREGYQGNFDVIFVDEYQDVNSNDHGLVKSLWNRKGNRLIVFGDDDQNIYSFRGGSSSFMLELAQAKMFRTVVLRQNYRNDEAIMGVAKKLIKKGNFKRIAKDIVTQMNTDSCLYKCVSQEAYDLDYMVNQLIKEGYSYKDICITSYSNETLAKHKSEISFPSCLATRDLIESAFFNVLEACSHVTTDDALSKLCLIFKRDDLLLKEGELFDNIRNSDCELLNEVITLAINKSNYTVSEYISNMSDLLGLGESFEYERITSDVGQLKNPDSFKDFDEYLYTSLKLESDTQFDIDQKDRVVFITQHKSKGLEWPVVIYLSGSKKDTELEPEFIHRMYVTMTRAKSKLIICGADSRIYDALELTAEDFIIEGKEECMGA